ncbi:MAG: AMP-binding protein [Solirubrobacterales bacterium]|nr:AMP-binding protein [Solirubrobacterales bacterium]
MTLHVTDEPAALELTTLCAAFQATAASDPEAVALRTPGGSVEVSWREYARRVERIAAGLAGLGTSRGDAVALLMVNRPEFHLCDTAALHLGAIPFSIYNTLPAEQIVQLLSNAGSRVVICESQFAERLLEAGARTGVEHVVCIDHGPDGTLPLAELERRGSPEFDFEAAWRAVGPEDVLTLIYTSGTTGPPKGVELTHANMLAELRATSGPLPVVPGDRCLSYLPSAHIADRWLTHYPGLVFGAQITCVADAAELPAALVDTRPTTWGAVPRVWEKLKGALEAGIAAEPDPTRAAALRGAIEVGRRKVRAEQAANAGHGPGPDEGLLAEFEAADEAVLSRLRAKLGLDRARWSVAGAAPTGVDVLEFFAAIGLPICELWGMSELSAAATLNRPARIRFGTVGTALPGIELALADDGELLCRGPIVMRGYRGEPEKTTEAIDPEGWLHSGDVAEIDTDGHVRIVDRKKELIINAAGKNMSPANIEAKLKAASPLIAEAVAIGDRRPFNVALIVLDPEACAAHAAAEGLPDGSVAALSRDPGVVAAVGGAVEQANQQLARVEQIKRHAILAAEWPAGGDELTPTMKLKRKPIADKYSDEIDALYQ